MTRRGLWALAGGVVLCAGLWGAWQAALWKLQGALRQALGPRAQVQALTVNWNGVTITGLQLAAAPGWPDPEEASARRIWVQPELRSLWSGPWRIRQLVVEDGHISLLRDRAGRLRLLPGLFDTPSSPAAPASAASTPADSPDTLIIQQLRLSGVRVDLYDDSFRPALRRPHHLQLDDLSAQVDGLHLPRLAQPVQLDIQGLLRGAGGAANHDGQLKIEGSVTPAHHDARLKAQLHTVDLRVLQPYLLTVNAGGIRQGRLDLAMQVDLKANRLHAPGTVTLADLTLGHGSGWWDRLGTASRQAVLDTLAEKGRIEVHFTLDGRLDDPSFSVNDSLAQRFATGLAKSVGVSVGGVVEGVGQMIKGLFGR